MARAYGFGLSQEDERSEATALRLPAGRVLAVASAGDMPLSLLALGAGAVVAVDVDENQLHLCELKRGALVALDREPAIRFLGFLPASRRERAQWLSLVLPLLPVASRDFWNTHRTLALDGAIWGGRYEQYVRRLRRLAWPFTGRTFRRLVQSTSPEAQRDFFDASFDRSWLRALFRVAFRPRVYAGRGIQRQALTYAAAGNDVGDRFFATFRNACTQSPACDNWLLQVHVLGEVAGPDAVPEYLTPHGFRAARARCDAVTFIRANVADYLDSDSVGTFDGFHLSNLPDWVSAPAFERIAALAARHAHAQSRVVWRYLHHQPAESPALRDVLVVDRHGSATLTASDRFPVYTIEVATVARPGAGA